MTGVETALLLSGLTRACIWLVGAVLCSRTGNRLAVLAFTLLTMIAFINTGRDVGWIDPTNPILYVVKLIATPISAMVVLFFIVDRNRT